MAKTKSSSSGKTKSVKKSTKKSSPKKTGSTAAKKTAKASTSKKTAKSVKKSTKAAASKKKTSSAKSAPKKSTKAAKSTKKSTKKKTVKKSAAPKATASKSAKPPVKKTVAKALAKAKPEDMGVDDSDHTPTIEELKKVKTGLTKKDLDHYQSLLLQKRAELVGDLAALEGDARIDGGNLSHMPLHMADIGSDVYEQEFTLGLAESDRRLLREIDEALVRIHNGIYGACLESAKPIPKVRLDAKPWAKYTIEVVREMERTGRIR